MIKKLSFEELEPGMIVLEPIVTQHGQTIIPAGEELTRQIINKVKLYNITRILVDVQESPVEQIMAMGLLTNEAPVSEAEPAAPSNSEPILRSEKELLQNTRIAEIKPNSQAVVKSPEFMVFQVDYLLATSTLRSAFINIARNRNYHIDEAALVATISTLYTSRKTITELFDMIYQMRSIDDSIFSHCVNVALISRMIGRWLHLDTHELDVLTCCGLFHDIGKIAIPDKILNKPGKLTDEEFNTIKSHPRIGYELLRNQNIDNRIKQSALMHHERYDGSGYPGGFSSELLIDYAMIVAIADVYDAMTATRSYREPLCPFQVIANFEQEGFQKYHTKFLLVFLNRIATTYQNNRVLLNDGRACKIVMLNQNNLSKPMVQFDDGTCIDLATSRDLYIKKVL